MRRIVLVVLLGSAAGCNLIPLACPAVIYRAIDVDVIDARTDAFVALGASGTIQDGSYVDSLRVVGWRGSAPNDTVTTLGAGLGRPGRYDLLVVREGYRPWQRSNVPAREGPCGVETTRIRAELEPL